MSAAIDPTVSTFDGPPQVRVDGAESWLVRSANFLVRLTRCTAGARIAQDCVDESFVHVMAGAARLSAGEASADLDPGKLAIAPPGRSEIAAAGDALVVSIFTTRETAMAAQAANAARYASTEGVAPLEDWPMPVGGYRLRVYNLADYDKPDSLMRLFRTRSLMANLFRHRDGPRDIHKLSPHSHDDFEQGSFCLEGEWSHHLRYPWTADMTTWRADEEAKVGSPSLLVVPPKVIHTSRNTSQGRSRLMDIFAGPRMDFSRKPGLVCNEDEYPAPSGA